MTDLNRDGSILFASIMTNAMRVIESKSTAEQNTLRDEIVATARTMIDAGADPANLVMQVACAGMGVASPAMKQAGYDPSESAFQTEAAILLDEEGKRN